MTVEDEALAELIVAALELCPSEPAWSDERITWVEVQVDKRDLERFNRAVTERRKWFR